MQPQIPQERTRTTREALEDELRHAPGTAHELSQRVGISEKDVAHHLEHLTKTLKAQGEKLVTQPASCIACGFVFAGRDKLTKPGSCPQCKSTRIDPPSFSIADA